MTNPVENKLIIAISSRALFNLDEGHEIYINQGLSAYTQYQLEKEDEILLPGSAFPLVKKLLAIKDLETQQALVEVILLSRNDANTGLRILNSIKHYKLNLTRAAFCNGESPYAYVSPFQAQLFLSANPEDVRQTLAAGFAAATILTDHSYSEKNTQVRIAFDGDAVIFSDDSEKIYQQQGIQAFTENEKSNAKTPLPGGPFKGFLQALHTIQRKFPANDCPIRTALVTARAAPAHERVIHTLRAWKVRIDQALFLGGLPKGKFLNAFEADLFFDDQKLHCQSAAEHVNTGHVPYGVMNKKIIRPN